MTKPTEHNSKSATANAEPSKGAIGAAGSTKGQPVAKPETTTATTSPPLPKSWSEIRVGSLVIAHESIEDGWWEATVTEARDDVLTLRWRDYPRQVAVTRNRKEVALLFSGN